LPHITEELWRRVYDESESVHTTDWPTAGSYDADLDAGETAMAVISALRGYKSDHGLALNAELSTVKVVGHVGEFADAVAGAMHVAEIEVSEDEPDITTEVSGVDLDYSLVGPEFGNEVGDIDAAIEAGEFEVDGETLVVGDEYELDDEMFEIERTRTYSGEGQMVETDHAVVIVQE
jgi:valyl-tRNA synthetase